MRTLCIVLVCVMFFSSKVTVYGNDSVEELEGYDFSDIDKLLSSEEHEESFGELFKELIQGDSTDVFKRMFSMVGDKLFGELSTNKGVIIRIVLLAIGAALLSKLSIIFAGSKMSDMGFFAVFSVLMVLLVSAFSFNVKVATDIVNVLVNFMKYLIPGFFIAVGAANGITASLGMYEIAFISIMAVEYVILNFVLPAVSVYVIILIINNILEEDYLSKPL